METSAIFMVMYCVHTWKFLSTFMETCSYVSTHPFDELFTELICISGAGRALFITHIRVIFCIFNWKPSLLHKQQQERESQCVFPYLTSWFLRMASRSSNTNSPKEELRQSPTDSTHNITSRDNS